MRGATGTGTRCFFGFFFSRLLRCCPLAMAVLRDVSLDVRRHLSAVYERQRTVPGVNA